MTTPPSSRPRHDPNAATRPVQPNPPPSVAHLHTSTGSPFLQTPPPSPSGYPPLPSQYAAYRDQRRKQRQRQNLRLGCGAGLAMLVLAVLCLAILAVGALFIAPLKANILVLGIDRVIEGTSVGRSDTFILVRADSTRLRIATLAIPRDLWVQVPGYGQNRINTAHFYAEAAQPGSGPANAIRAVQVNFGVEVQYYIRLHLEGVPALVDAMGGVTVDLAEATTLFPAGKSHLNGTQALAFVRDRAGGDDFFRMEHGQIFIKAAAQQMLSPLTWLRFPAIYSAFWNAVDTNLSFWQLANLAMTAVRLGPSKIESHVLPREYTTPTMINGASVLLPNWMLIRPLISEIFQ